MPFNRGTLDRFVSLVESPQSSNSFADLDNLPTPCEIGEIRSDRSRHQSLIGLGLPAGKGDGGHYLARVQRGLSPSQGVNDQPPQFA